jgi:hypothetical protein
MRIHFNTTEETLSTLQAVLADAGEVFGVQTCPTNERSIDVWLTHQFEDNN